MIKLENEFYIVKIKSKGAELTSIFCKKDNTEHLYQDNPVIWGWQAPNLFPFVGESYEHQIHVDGQSYPMGRHGFARDKQFKKVECTPTHVQFSLHFNEETLAVYPFKFEFEIFYTLIKEQIKVTYKVINRDKKDIYFSVGAHPAFAVPFYPNENYEDYYVELEAPEDDLQLHLIAKNGCFNNQTEPAPLNGQKIHLTKTLFDKDALIFKNLKSRKATIKSKNHQTSLSVTFPHFNYLGIWAKPNAPFVCIEPWLGCADTDGNVTDIKDKEAILKLEHGHVFETDFCIAIN